MQKNILVLGAYGLAGRAIVQELLDTTPHTVTASGRNTHRLTALCDAHANERLRALPLDATDDRALTAACAQTDFVINASGPYARFGAHVARTVITAGRPYLDCASEQIHYESLRPLDALARSKHLPLITGAGAIPGLSTLLITHLLRNARGATSVDCGYAQLRHAYQDSGLGSMMSGVLEAVNNPASLRQGKRVPCLLGKARRTLRFPPPIGARPCFELPNIDVLTLPGQYPLQDLRIWFYMGDAPTWLFPLIRILRPDRHPCVYARLEKIVDAMNKKETAHAIATGATPEGVIYVQATSEAGPSEASLTFRDGAVATAFLPAHLADQWLQGNAEACGLLTPPDCTTLTECLPKLQRLLTAASLPESP
jgi:short subunit dehydrogenase-like uncharacterized protein